jgi:HEAT repeat protein
MERSGHLTSFFIAGILAFPQCETVLSQEITRAPTTAVASTSSLSSMAWDVLRDGVADKDAEHRRNAVAAIGTIGPAPQAVHMVEMALQDKDPQVRQTAAITLGDMKATKAIPYLQAALDDTPEVSFSAAKALWEMGDKSGRWIFQQVLEGERTNAPGKLHSALAKGKKKLTPQQLALMGAKDAVGTVFGPASLGVDAVQEAVKTAKKDTGAPGRTVAAQMLATDPDPYALILLEWALGDDNWGVRVAVAKALGQRGNDGTIAKLEPQLGDDHHQVRYMAAASMIKLSLTADPSPFSTASPVSPTTPATKTQQSH